MGARVSNLKSQKECRVVERIVVFEINTAAMLPYEHISAPSL
jgi:hypothetical protein